MASPASEHQIPSIYALTDRIFATWPLRNIEVLSMIFMETLSLRPKAHLDDPFFVKAHSDLADIAPGSSGMRDTRFALEIRVRRRREKATVGEEVDITTEVLVEVRRQFEEEIKEGQISVTPGDKAEKGHMENSGEQINAKKNTDSTGTKGRGINKKGRIPISEFFAPSKGRNNATGSAPKAAQSPISTPPSALNSPVQGRSSTGLPYPPGAAQSKKGGVPPPRPLPPEASHTPNHGGAAHPRPPPPAQSPLQDPSIHPDSQHIRINESCLCAHQINLDQWLADPPGSNFDDQIALRNEHIEVYEEQEEYYEILRHKMLARYMKKLTKFQQRRIEVVKEIAERKFIGTKSGTGLS
jgi:hypothetical protein